MRLLIATCFVFLASSSAAPNGDSRIMGGNLATNGQFKFAVGIQFEGSIGSPTYCTGTLITPDVVLTAAHCAKYQYSAKVYLGDVNFLSPNAEEITSTDFTVHEDFLTTPLQNDLAIIRLPHPVQTSATIQPLSVMKETVNADDDVTTIGFGATSSSNWLLNYADLQVTSDNTCQTIYGSQYVLFEQFCLNNPNFECLVGGDSGGPTTNQAGTELYGVNSYSTAGGCMFGSAGVDTAVGDYKAWLDQKVGVGNLNWV